MKIIESEKEEICTRCNIRLMYTKDDILYSYSEYKYDHGIDRTISEYIKCPRCHRYIKVESIGTNMTKGHFDLKYKGRILYLD